MALSLKDGVYAVRTQLGELQEYLWSDDQIIFDLNHAARKMCSIAGDLTKFENITLGTTPAGAQEAPLDLEVDKVKACKYFAGQLFPLEPHDWKSLQAGASVGSIPRWYYLKTSTRDMTPQSVATSDIVDIPISPNAPFGDVYRTVVGVWPIPPEPAIVHIWYSYIHKWMQDPGDPCAIPDQFLYGWAAAAIARCWSIQKAYAEAQQFQAQYEAECEKYRVYASAQRQQDKSARYGTVVEPWRQSASSSVIFVDPMPTMGG